MRAGYILFGMTHTAGEALRAWREGQGLSQVDLAGRLGISQSMVSYLERGTLLPVRTLAIALEDMAGISVRAWDEHASSDADDASCTQSGSPVQVAE